MFKFIHTADIHLDSPLLSLAKYDGAPVEEFRSATRRAFDNIVDLAIKEAVAFVLISGDLYDSDCKNFHTPLHFRKQMERLAAHQIRVFIINGNHDAANAMHKTSRLKLPDNVHWFPVKKPGTVLIDELQVAIHGQGFASRAVTEDLSKNFPEAVSNYTNIGMLHTSCGHHEMHDNYAPSTIPGLSDKKYDYWALGHIHKPKQLAAGRSRIEYCGNPQGRSVKETGPRGCLLVTVDQDLISAKFQETDVLRWINLEVETDQCETADETLRAIETLISAEQASAGNRPLAVRIELTGSSAAHEDFVGHEDHWDGEIRDHVLSVFDDQVWVEKIKFNTRALVEHSRELDSALNELVQQLQRPELGAAAMEKLQADFAKMLTSIPSDPRIDRAEIDVENGETRRKILEGAKELLVARLTEVGGDA